MFKRKTEVPQKRQPVLYEGGLATEEDAQMAQNHVLPRLFETPYHGDIEHDELTDPEHAFYEHSHPEVSQLADEQPETTLGEGVVFKGEISFNRYLRIDGTFEGKDISSQGRLVVGATGTVYANISVKTAIVEGRVIGHINAQRLELRSGARWEGNITTNALVVDEGVTIMGQVQVTPQTDQADVG